MIKLYRVIAADGADDLEHLVNEAMADGWEPVGGIAISSVTRETRDGDVFFDTLLQAMRKNAL